ncbi:rCG63139, partial [Rattus norvegicus]
MKHNSCWKLPAAQRNTKQDPSQAIPKEVPVSRITSLRKLLKGAALDAVSSWGDNGETQLPPAPRQRELGIKSSPQGCVEC